MTFLLGSPVSKKEKHPSKIRFCCLIIHWDESLSDRTFVMDVDHVLSLHHARASADRDSGAGHVRDDPEPTEKGQRLEQKW